MSSQDGASAGASVWCRLRRIPLLYPGDFAGTSLCLTCLYCMGSFRPEGLRTTPSPRYTTHTQYHPQPLNLRISQQAWLGVRAAHPLDWPLCFACSRLSAVECLSICPAGYRKLARSDSSSQQRSFGSGSNATSVFDNGLYAKSLLFALISGVDAQRTKQAACASHLGCGVCQRASHCIQQAAFSR
jgi:hypothetical protein